MLSGHTIKSFWWHRVGLTVCMHRCALLRSYLSVHKISMTLSMRVKKYVDWKLQMLSSQKSNADVLSILPKLLVVELLYEVRGPIITLQKFFLGLDTEFTRTFRRLCHEAVSQIWQAPAEVIFTAVDEAAHMYFIVHGILHYKVIRVGKRTAKKSFMAEKQSAGYSLQTDALSERDYSDDNLHNLTIHEVLKDNVMCEAALWVDWEHVGELRTKTDASVLALESKSFETIIQTTPPAHASSVLYARRFLAALNKFGKPYTDILPEGGIVAFARHRTLFKPSNNPDDDDSDED